VSTTEAATAPLEPQPPRATVTISPDQLAAFLLVTPAPNDAAEPSTVEHALISLADARVTFGLDRGRVGEAVESPGRMVLVAEGRAACDGCDGRVEYAASVLAVGGRPHVGDDGGVNLFDLDLVHNVEVGALLATRVLPTSGEPGMTVHGRPIRARPGRAAHVRCGPVARLTDDGLQVLAAVTGHAALLGDVVSVSPIYYVRGDVGPATGHVEFVGNVHVSGDVMGGYRVQARGDVEIQGSVAAGEVEAGGNVSVRYGIQGHHGRGRVVAAGNVRAKFIEFAEVRAGGSVYASDGMVRSTVEAGGRVEVLGQHGSIVGGRILAREIVSVRDLGSPHGIATEVVVGADPALLAEAQQSRSDAIALVRQLDEVQQRIGHLQDRDRHQGLNAQSRVDLDKFHVMYRSLLEQRTALGHRQEELAELLQALRSAVVIVHGTCHADVHITIGTMTYAVRQPWQAVRFERNFATHEIELFGLQASNER